MANRVVYGLLLRRNLRRERIFRDRTNPFDVYDDVELYSRFRFRRADILDLCDVIEDDIDHPFQRRGSLTPLLQLLIALRFYASGCFQEVIGDLFGVDKSTVCRVIDRVSRAFSNRLEEYVRMPTVETANRTMEQFFRMANFPNVIGCIDCTHIRIVAPKEDEQVYVDRRGNHSLNIQLLCDADMIIRNCVVMWPGSVHDSRILKDSQVFRIFQRIPRPLPGIILGDSGYPLKEWLMTPYLNPEGRAQQRFNAAHTSTRSTIERTNGILKKRWHCLQSQLRYEPAKACYIIMSCIILHNVATTLGLPEPDSDSDSDDSDSDEPDSDSDEDDGGVVELPGRLARERLVQRHFQ